MDALALRLRRWPGERERWDDEAAEKARERTRKRARMRRREGSDGQKVLVECARLAVEARARRAARAGPRRARRALHLSARRHTAGPRDLARLASACCEVDRRMYAAHNQQPILALPSLTSALHAC
jgi:hypothetical protein